MNPTKDARRYARLAKLLTHFAALWKPADARRAEAFMADLRTVVRGARLKGRIEAHQRAAKGNAR